jgi:hypothetical protein
MRVPERLSLPLSQFPRYRMTDALAQTLEPFRQTKLIIASRTLSIASSPAQAMRAESRR